jgi:DNA polymerase-4
MGQTYYDFARGIDLRPVEAIYIRKSVGCEHTLERDVCRTSSVIIELYHVATELVERLSRQQFVGNTLTLKIKFHDFTQVSRSHTTDTPLSSLKTILPLAKELLKKVDYRNHPIRLIGLSISQTNYSLKSEELPKFEENTITLNTKSTQLVIPFQKTTENNP